MPTKKPKILLIADVPDWIFAKHCINLKKNLSKYYSFTIKFDRENFNEDGYDLIYPLSFSQIDIDMIKNPKKYVTGIRSNVSWEELDQKDFTEMLNNNFSVVHVVSKELYKKLKHKIKNLRIVGNGFDDKIFKPIKNMQNSPKGQLIIGWCGNKGNPVKGFEEFIQPLSKIEGVKVVHCGYDTKNLPHKKMPKFYQQIDTYVCSSSSEGHNNSIAEAAAMGKSIITTKVGTVPEYLHNGTSALIVKRSKKSFEDACIKLRDSPELRKSLGLKAKEEVLKRFTWKKISQDYKAMFDDALSSK